MWRHSCTGHVIIFDYQLGKLNFLCWRHAMFTFADWKGSHWLLTMLWFRLFSWVFCFLVKGTKVRPDPMLGKNEAKRKFCAKFDGYGDFCLGLPLPLSSSNLSWTLGSTVNVAVVLADKIDELLEAAPLSDGQTKTQIHSTPIILVAGAYVTLWWLHDCKVCHTHVTCC